MFLGGQRHSRSAATGHPPHLVARSLKCLGLGVERDLTLISPDTTTLEAMDWLLETEAGCLLVVEAGRLVGIVTAWDFVNAAAHVLRQDLLAAGDEDA